MCSSDLISLETLSQISGRELLITHLGHWPSFHDFEVISITLERPIVFSVTHDLRATFFVFDLGKAPEDAERKQGTAELLFESVYDLKIAGFGYQNPIMGLSIVGPQQGGSRFSVQWLGTGSDHTTSFLCERISVLRIVDLNPFRKPFPGF